MKIVQITPSPALKKRRLEDSTAVDPQEWLERMKEKIIFVPLCLCHLWTPVPSPLAK